LSVSYCSWNASDILVMSAASETGKFRVVEAIQGDTPIGTVLTLQELAPPEGDATSLAEVAESTDPWNPRARFRFAAMDIFPAPPLRASDRIIVFLRRPGVPPEYDPGNPKVSVIGWQPANFWQELRASTVWLQDGMAYGYGQTINPGASHLMAMRATEEQVRRQIRAVLDLRAALDRALASTDPADRAWQLAALVRSGDLAARNSALGHLESGGAEAVDALDGLLADPDLWGSYWAIASSLVNTNVADIHLARILDNETRYWRRTCPGLQINWAATGMGAPAAHYRLAATLLELPGPESAQDRAAVAAFAQVWKTCPPTNQYAQDRVFPEIDRRLHNGR
jgi:hypothetical protein